MWLTSCFRALGWDSNRNRASRAGRPSPIGPRRSFRPGLELLEARTVPSAYTITTNADSGLGSLRAAVDAANAHAGADVVRFDPSLAGQTVTLTSGELLITDDLNAPQRFYRAIQSP